MRKHVSTHEGYELWAATYDGSANPVVAVDELVLGELVLEELVLGELGGGGLTVLDAGCGTGRHTLRLAERVERVIAMDFSAAMLAEARAKLARISHPGGALERVTFIEHDLQRPLPLAGDSVDVAVCALVGEHITDLRSFFSELTRVIRPGGWLVFSVYHPFLALAGKEANFRDEDSGIEYRLGAELHLIADYVNAALGAGLALEELREVVADEPLRGHIPDFARYRDKPLLLVLRLRVAASGP
jgi:malonyl-CoA O-methyltransferase